MKFDQYTDRAKALVQAAQGLASKVRSSIHDARALGPGPDAG